MALLLAFAIGLWRLAFPTTAATPPLRGRRDCPSLRPRPGGFPSPPKIEALAWALPRCGKARRSMRAIPWPSGMVYNQGYRSWIRGSSQMRIEVHCYSGYKADERPVSFLLGQRRLGVEEIVDRWYGEDYEYFKVLADDGATYLLRHHTAQERWELIQYVRGETGGRNG